MNHLFRLFWLLVTSRWRKRLSPSDLVNRTYFRVWPTDLDPLMHMNNGVYLSLMDLGRIDFMLRLGAWGKLRRAGIYPVLASEGIRFKKSLKVFQKFHIETRVAGWDDKYFYMGQKYFVGHTLYASAMIKARFLNVSGAKVSPEELWEVAGVRPELPNPLEPAVAALGQFERDLGN